MSAPMPNAAMRGPWGVPESLSDLRGPTEGTVSLPLHLCWSGDPEFDVTQPSTRLLMYQIVLTEGECTDIETFLNPRHLMTVWPKLRRLLNPRYTRPWEERFPQLVEAAKSAEPALQQELMRAKQAAREGRSI